MFLIIGLATPVGCGGETTLQLLTGHVDATGVGVSVDELRARAVNSIVSAVYLDRGDFTLPVPIGASLRLELSSGDRSTIPLATGSSSSAGIEVCAPGAPIDLGTWHVQAGCLEAPFCSVQGQILDQCRRAATQDCGVLGELVTSCHTNRDLACASAAARVDRCLHGQNPPPPPICDNDARALMGCLADHDCQSEESAVLARCTSPCQAEETARGQACGSFNCPPGALVATSSTPVPSRIGCEGAG